MRTGRRRALVGVVAALAALLVAVAAVPLPARLGTAPSGEVRWRDGDLAHAFLSPDDKWRLAADLDRIDPAYVEALIRLEDRRFWWHPGVDPLAVTRAAGQDILAGEVVSGASTLTMQLARLSEPRPRTLASKAIEAARAIQLEARLSKREILAAYLTLVPYGRNVEGIEAAARWIFGHSAADLSPPEIATLLAIPQDPTSRYPTPAHADRLRAARDAIAQRVFDPETAAEVARAPVPTRLSSVPRDLPQAAPWFRSRTSGGALVRTTLDSGVQRVVQRRVDAVAEELASRGIENGSVVVVETATAEIRGLAGNLAMGAPGGQIPAFDVARSPGSTLKPFLYAAGMDEGLFLPDTLLTDTPATWGGYAPQNYDGTWSGVVRAEDALSRSLNVPFVSALGRFGVGRFLGLLRTGNARFDARPGHHGLSLIVGGIELTPLDVAGLYVALANGGVARPLRWNGGEQIEGTALFSPGAAWLTRRALRLRDRPDFPDRLSLARLPPEIFWKTGTSFGNRDAWAVGAGERYTVAVWLGNLDQSPSAALVGADAAAPILFDILDGLGDARVTPDPAPPDIGPVEVCGLSGRRPGGSCPTRLRVVGIPSHVPPEPCSLHQQVLVNVSGLRVTPGCGTGDESPRVVTSWPPGVQRWLGGDRAGPSMPALAPGCGAPVARTAPRIRSPGAGDIAVLIPGVAAHEQEIPLEAEAESGATLAWYIDGAFLGRVQVEERLWWVPERGSHRLVVMDDAGLSRESRFEVR